MLVLLVVVWPSGAIGRSAAAIGLVLVLLNTQQAKLYFVGSSLLRVHLEACSLEILHVYRSCRLCGDFLECFAQREAELLKSAVLVPVLEDLAADRVLGLREPYFGRALMSAGLSMPTKAASAGLRTCLVAGSTRAAAFDMVSAQAAQEHVVGGLVFRVGLVAWRAQTTGCRKLCRSRLKFRLCTSVKGKPFT